MSVNIRHRCAGAVPFPAPALPGSGSKGHRINAKGAAVSQLSAPLGTAAMMGSARRRVKPGRVGATSRFEIRRAESAKRTRLAAYPCERGHRSGAVIESGC